MKRFACSSRLVDCEGGRVVSFLEARRVVAQFAGGPEYRFLFALSGTPEPFALYLQAAGATRGLTARPRFLPFNTLHQHLATDAGGETAVYLLLPWDLAPEADWRSGVPVTRTEVADLVERAERVSAALQRRTTARFLYLPAPLPPVVGFRQGERELAAALAAIAARLGALAIPAEAFSLGALFSSGCPVGGAWLGRVADMAVGALADAEKPAAKVLVTDLDNTLWSGVIAEDGAEGIDYRPQGAGYRHYVYQGLLARLRREGALLAAVSRNDLGVVLPPLRSGGMPLGEADFVAVVASYHAKSAQIGQLAAQLNLGLDSFVFIDDNPVELEEVQQALPAVLSVPFPRHDDELPGFLDRVSTLFERRELTAEDQERTEMYRRRLEVAAPVEAAGSDLTEFLRGLQMRLTVHDRSTGDRTRAVQLINKTNQFNANGRRWTAEEISAVLARGGRLFGASLADRSGSHGEIISCLIGPDGVIEAFVMSCRVFQRRVELGFLTALVGRNVVPIAVRYARTDRNEPFTRFVGDPAFGLAAEEPLQFDAAAFAIAHAEVLDLFEVTWD